MIKTRIAPSPTGDPHIGTAYSALFNFAFAKKNNGKFILRIEDTDRTRLQPDSEKKIIDAMEWLGLNYDEGPFKQSERLEMYQQAAKDLVEKGKAYYCDCTPERLTKVRDEQQARGEVPRYDKKCRFKTLTEISKGSHVVRLKVPEDGEVRFEDLVRGKIIFKNKDIDDAVLLKSDGWPTYHLAVVVDDSDMKISHVIRAEEWLSSTPKHILIYEAMSKKAPVFAHLPLLRNSDRSKISKRKNPVSLNWYKEEGFLPEALLNHLSLMGWSMPDGREKFSLQEFVDNFDLTRVDPAGPIFDLVKLEWLNGEWIRGFSDKELAERIKKYTKRSEKNILRILPLIKERLKKLSEFDRITNYFFDKGVNININELVPKSQNADVTRNVFQEVIRGLRDAENWDEKSLKLTLEKKPEQYGWSKKDLFQTIRYITTGNRATPPLFDTLEAIGKENTISRIEKALKLLR